MASGVGIKVVVLWQFRISRVKFAFLWPIFCAQAKNWFTRVKFAVKEEKQGCPWCLWWINAKQPPLFQSSKKMVHLYGTMTPGNMFTFNANDGYLEALLRGFRSGILSTADYANLIQCDQLEGMKGDDMRVLCVVFLFVWIMLQTSMIMCCGAYEYVFDIPM